jgi:salicylate hydroxylase
MPNKLDNAAALYNKLRYPRATKIQSFARAQRHKNHMNDGPEQEVRDAAMASTATETKSAHEWSWKGTDDDGEKEWIPGLYEYDAELMVSKALHKLNASA